jgi:hypothetical protein
MSYMQPEIEYGVWLVVQTRHGPFYLPSDIFPQTPDGPQLLDYMGLTDTGDIIEVQPTQGYGARLYYGREDQFTEWVVFPSHELAEEYLNDLKYQ